MKNLSDMHRKESSLKINVISATKSNNVENKNIFDSFDKENTNFINDIEISVQLSSCCSSIVIDLHSYNLIAVSPLKNIGIMLSS